MPSEVLQRVNPTINSLARREFVTVSLDSHVSGAISKVRHAGKRCEIFYIYVVDNINRLCGIISIRHLLSASDDERIRDIYSSVVVSLPENTPVKEAYQVFSKARFLSLPVVNSGNEIVGVVLAHELLEEQKPEVEHLFDERSRGELFELLGIKAENASAKIGSVALSRLPWLLVNLVGGAISAFFIQHLGRKLSGTVELLAFVPTLLVLSESIGMQSASMVIAHIHRSSGKGRNSDIFWKEFKVAGLLGMSCAFLVSVPVLYWKHSHSLALTIFLTISLGTIGVSVLGNVIPRLFHRFRVDPRVAAGPVVLSVADCSVLIIYLFLALLITH